MEGVEHSAIIDTWLKKHSLIYTETTRNPFVLSIRDGTVDLSSFKRWLEQEYIFVRAFVPFTSSILVKAWKESDDSSDIEVILGGVAYLNDELAWFKNEALKWNVSLSNIVPSKANQDYLSFLETFMSSEVEYPVAITALWAIEAVYQKSFAQCLEEGNKTPVKLKETCQRWGNDSFGQYCHSLHQIANRCLEKASELVRTEAELALLRILEHEIDFWNMSHGET